MSIAITRKEDLRERSFSKKKYLLLTCYLESKYRYCSSELRHGPSIFLLKSEGGGLSLNALDIDK